MLWAALSAFIMSITGTGDDTFAFRKALERLEEAVEAEVHDTPRRCRAQKTLVRVRSSFDKHRQRVGKISACLEKADRTYAVTEADYRRCLSDARPAFAAAADELIALDREFRAGLTPAEYEAVRRSARR
ncbi:MAG TPA: hypothetical protein VGK73_14465 [Polyangiaceae bacterium]